MPSHKALSPPAGYVHNRTFFQHNRWSAYDLIGELLGRSITQISIALIEQDWTVSWVEPRPPNVIKEAEDTPA